MGPFFKNQNCIRTTVPNLKQLLIFRFIGVLMLLGSEARGSKDIICE